VREGDRVLRGQVLAVLEKSDLRARLASAEARIKEREAELRRIVNGARDEERREAKTAVDETYAVLEKARTQTERRDGLFAKGIITREEDERSHREFQVATARHEAARERLTLMDTEAREEDRAKAEAALSLARTEAEEARAMLEKSEVRSPITGIILHRYS